MPNGRTVVQVRLTARDLKRVAALAASDGVTVSEFVRWLIRRELGEERRATRSHQPAVSPVASGKKNSTAIPPPPK